MKYIPPQQLHSSADIPVAGSEAGEAIHIPVLLEETIAVLAPQAGERYLDLTAGYGGHARRIIDSTGAEGAVLVDRDAMAIASLDSFARQGAMIVHSDFARAAESFVQEGETFDIILVDLGVSSPQLDRSERGFSLRTDGPLDMRMDARQDRTAADIVNRTSEQELMRLIIRYGEERPRQASRIAQAIVRARPIMRTRELADIIASVHRGGWQKIHPATRTFQAIRIALNDELGQINRLLMCLPQLLRSGGRVAVISFHSLEDRLVKQYFTTQQSAGYEATLRVLTKKPILGKDHHDFNPRARSAVLRVAVKI